MCTSSAMAREGGQDPRTGPVDTSVGSLSGGAVDMGLLQHGGEAADELVGLGVSRDPLARAAAGVQHGRVVAAAEGAPDRRQGRVGQLARQVHCDLSGPGDPGSAVRRAEGLRGDAEPFAGGRLDLFDRVDAVGSADTVGIEPVQHVRDEPAVDRSARE